jgi:cyclopropane fatty-acyl-phospholipid synthase-like methyltransferase
MSHMRPTDFEALYQQDLDPWGYETSGYERAKYDATLDACGPGPFAHALELGSSIGVLSARLAGRCKRLTTVDGSPTAVQAARRRLDGRPAIDTLLGEIPDAIPDGPFDLVLASEILYYLAPEALQGTLERVRDSTGAAARVVAVHWRPAGPERPFTAAEVHDRLRFQTWLDPVESSTTDDYLLDVLVRR